MKLPGSLLIRIITHNIRYATTNPFKNEELWSVRQQYVINQLQFASRLNPESFLCLQEGLHNQVEDIYSGLNTNGERWDYIGVGRSDGKQSGEYSPIFYRPDVWDLESNKTVWLSETPDVPSKGWDAAAIRIVTIGVFKHHASRKKVLAMSTHMDHKGTEARRESAKLILKEIEKHLEHDHISGTFIGGDFNSEENQEAYEELTKPGSPVVDVQKEISPSHRYGNVNTYTGFGYEGYPATRIDYVFAGPRHHSKFPWDIKGYGVLPNQFDDGVVLSDHRAVIADLELS